MPYYDTIDEDLKRAREILARGKADLRNTGSPPEYQELAGGTIYGGDTYAAYKLLESFVAEIERLTEAGRHAAELIVTLRAWMAEYPNDKYTGEWWTQELDRLIAREKLKISVRVI